VTHLSPEETPRVIELSMHFAREGMTEELAGCVDYRVPSGVQGEYGNAPPMLAASHGHPETVRMQTERGADVDLLNHGNQTPLAGALFKGEDEVVRPLITAGAGLEAGTPSARDTAAMFDRLDLVV